MEKHTFSPGPSHTFPSAFQIVFYRPQRYTLCKNQEECLSQFPIVAGIPFLRLFRKHLSTS